MLMFYSTYKKMNFNENPLLTASKRRLTLPSLLNSAITKIKHCRRHGKN